MGVWEFTTERGRPRLSLRLRLNLTTDTLGSDMPDLDTLDSDTLVWDTPDSDTLVSDTLASDTLVSDTLVSTTTERGRLRLSPTTDTLVSDSLVSDMLGSTPAMSVSAPTTWELPCLVRKLRNNEKFREVRNFCWKQFEIKCSK